MTEPFANLRDQIRELSNEYEAHEMGSSMLYQLKKFYITCLSKEMERDTGQKASKAMILRLSSEMNMSYDTIKDLIYRPTRKRESGKPKKTKQMDMEL